MSLFDEAALRVVRPASIYLPLGGAGTWYEEQVFDFQAFVDPSDATRVLCYVSGMASPVAGTNIVIGRFHAALSNLHSWTSDGPVLSPTAAAWDSSFVRMGSLFYDGSTYYLFYTGSNDSGGSASIGLATSSNGTTFTKYAGNPILTPGGQGRSDGNYVSEPAVIKEGSSWTMIYSYRNGGTIMPGFRFATSSDGTTWAKGAGGDILTIAPLYAEFHQILKFSASDYALVYEAGNATVPYRIYVARATTAGGTYTNWASNPLLSEAGGAAWDRYHVSTPFAVQLNGQWYLFYSGAGDITEPYASNTWPGSLALLLYTTTNLQPHSESFDDAVWTKLNSSVTANATTAPDGTVTADKLVENSATSGHSVASTVALANDTPYTFSEHWKVGERTWIYLCDFDFFGTTRRAWFNLATGAIGTVNSGLTAAISAVANGFYRCSISFQSSTDAVNDAEQVTSGLATGDANIVYAGNGASGAYPWGAQLEVGPLTAYVKNDPAPAGGVGKPGLRW